MEFIITCGTSQTGNFEHLKPENRCYLDLHGSGYKLLKGDFLQAEKNDQLARLYQEKAASLTDIFAQKILDFVNSENPIECIAEDFNPLGAELSTLYLFFHEKKLLPASGHIFHILMSDSYLGWFNAIILKKVIEGTGWGRVVGPYLVANLKSKPDNRKPDPLLSLSLRLKEILKEKREMPPTIVMSGGFKSVIPCLTMYSAIFALPLIYLFETSGQIKEITPVQKVNKSQESKKLWGGLSDIDIARNIPWLQEALDFRTSSSFTWL